MNTIEGLLAAATKRAEDAEQVGKFSQDVLTCLSRQFEQERHKTLSLRDQLAAETALIEASQQAAKELRGQLNAAEKNLGETIRNGHTAIGRLIEERDAALATNADLRKALVEIAENCTRPWIAAKPRAVHILELTQAALAKLEAQANG